MKQPFEVFLQQMLEQFRKHLAQEGLKARPIEHRMLGARQFARFLLGTPHSKGERTKGPGGKLS